MSTLRVEIGRVKSAKTELKSSITAKGVAVGNEKLDAYPALVDAIPTGGGGQKFYKCVGVDTAAKTWTGVEATQGSDGSFTFGTDITELTYDRVVPVVHNIYNESTTFEVANSSPVPTDDLIFYESLATSPTSDKLTIYGDVQYQTLWGIPGMKISSGQGLAWLGVDEDSRRPHTIFFAFCGADSTGYMCFRRYSDGYSQMTGSWRPRLGNAYGDFNWNGNVKGSFSPLGKLTPNEWITFAITLDSQWCATIYINGVSACMSGGSTATTGSSARYYSLGCLLMSFTDTPQQNFVGTYSGLRFYDRALTADEIMRLHSTIQPVMPEATGSFAVTTQYSSYTLNAVVGTTGANRKWLSADGTYGMMFDGTYWVIGYYDADYGISAEYYDSSYETDENGTPTGTPIGMGATAEQLAGSWSSSWGDGSATVVYNP